MKNNPYRKQALKQIEGIRTVRDLLTRLIRVWEMDIKVIDNGPFNHKKENKTVTNRKVNPDA